MICFRTPMTYSRTPVVDDDSGTTQSAQMSRMGTRAIPVAATRTMASTRVNLRTTGGRMGTRLPPVSSLSPPRSQSQLVSHSGERLDGELLVLAAVGRRDLDADAGLALRHDRVGEADRVDPLLEQPLGHAAGQ